MIKAGCDNSSRLLRRNHIKLDQALRRVGDARLGRSRLPPQTLLCLFIANHFSFDNSSHSQNKKPYRNDSFHAIYLVYSLFCSCISFTISSAWIIRKIEKHSLEKSLNYHLVILLSFIIYYFLYDLLLLILYNLKSL